jgi:hypothetical protein
VRFLLLAAALLQAPSPSVEGTVIRAGTTEPIAHARVMLTRVDGGLADTRVAQTDDEGRFAFRGVTPGDYRLIAQHEAHVRSSSRRVTIAASGSIRDLVVPLTATGVITGRVVDEYGDPVSDVYVRATTVVGADLKVGPYHETTTNDLGEYRLFGLTPGAYVVSAAPYLAARIENTALGNGPATTMIVVPTRPSPYSPGEGRGMSSLAQALKAGNYIPFAALRRESPVTVYYPGTSEAAAAAPIDVPAGAVVGAINVTTVVRADR